MRSPQRTVLCGLPTSSLLQARPRAPLAAGGGSARTPPCAALYWPRQWRQHSGITSACSASCTNWSNFSCVRHTSAYMLSVREWRASDANALYCRDWHAQPATAMPCTDLNGTKALARAPPGGRHRRRGCSGCLGCGGNKVDHEGCRGRGGPALGAGRARPALARLLERTHCGRRSCGLAPPAREGAGVHAQGCPVGAGSRSRCCMWSRALPREHTPAAALWAWARAPRLAPASAPRARAGGRPPRGRV